MPASKVTFTSAAYILAEEQKLLDEWRKIGRKTVLERKSLHRWRRILRRLAREVAVESKEREHEMDLEEEEVVKKGEIAAEDGRRAEGWAWVREVKGGSEASAAYAKSGTKLNLTVRRRKDAEAEEDMRLDGKGGVKVAGEDAMEVDTEDGVPVDWKHR